MAALRSSSRIRNKMTAKSAKSSNIAAPAPALHWTELVDTSSDGNENEQESDEQSASAYEMDMVPHATAPRQFFDTVELVENMLLFLLSNNTAALIKTSGLSPLFQPVINGSITLQRGLFLTPHERNLLDKTFHETGSDEVTDIFGEEIPMGALDIPTDPKFLRANPMLFRLQLDATDWTQELGMNVDMYDYLDIYNKIELKGTTFGNMLLTQPPVKEIKVLFSWSGKRKGLHHVSGGGSSLWKMKCEQNITFSDLVNSVRAEKRYLDSKPTGTEQILVTLEKPWTVLDLYVQTKDGKYFLKSGCSKGR